VGVVVARRFDVALVQLDPTRGSEIRKARPCVVVSPDDLNQAPHTVIVAPMTTGGRAYPWRVPVSFDGKDGHIALDQLRTVDVVRVIRIIGQIDDRTADRTLQFLTDMFAP
jgi:mRNA interferase MazF